jgi:4-hydroxy-2-oxoheptanedioate aldolase
MIKSKVLGKLKKKKPVLCTKVNFFEPSIVEMVGLMGFDCLWICNEHQWQNPETLAHMIRAARLTGTDAMVRIAKAGYPSAIKPLEMGAKGIMVPHILSVEEAKFWIRTTKFHPYGRRALDGVNADADWALADVGNYLTFSNKETFLVLQIEDPEILPMIEDIAQLDNFDILFLGPGDLAHSMGLTPGKESKKIWEILENLGKICSKYGKIAGAPCGSPENAKKLLDLGYLFIASGADIILLKNAFLKLKEDYRKLGFLL